MGKTAVQEFQMEGGSEEKGQGLHQDKGSLLVTWTSPVYLPSLFQCAPFHSRQAGIMRFSLVGGNMKTFIQGKRPEHQSLVQIY